MAQPTKKTLLKKQPKCSTGTSSAILKHHFSSKSDCGKFWGNFWKFWATFYFNIWSQWLRIAQSIVFPYNLICKFQFPYASVTLYIEYFLCTKLKKIKLVHISAEKLLDNRSSVHDAQAKRPTSLEDNSNQVTPLIVCNCYRVQRTVKDFQIIIYLG